MTTKTGKTFGLALIMAVGILAVMFALGTFSSQKAGAAIVDGEATLELPDAAILGATSQAVTVTFTNDAAMPAGTLVKITLSGIEFPTTDVDDSDITISGMSSPHADDPATYTSIAVTTIAAASAPAVTTLPVADEDDPLAARTITFAIPDTDTTQDEDQGLAADEPITIVVSEFDIPNAPTNVKATVQIGDEDEVSTNQIDIGIALDATPSTPGAVSYIEVGVISASAYAATGIPVGTRITIDFDQFSVPASIDEDDVSLRGLSANVGTDGTDTATQTQIETPDNVSVSGKKVTITVPDMGDEDNAQNLATRYRVIFDEEAGIAVPTAAGTYRIKIGEAESSPVMVDETLSLSTKKGARGTETTLTGKGFASVQKVFVETDGTEGIGNDDHVLATDPTLDKNAFEVTFTADTGFKGGVNTIKVVDRSDSVVETAAEAVFTVTGKISLDPETAKPGQKITVTAQDLGDNPVFADSGHKIGGEDVTLEEGTTGKSRKITVPPGTSGGTKTVRVMIGGDPYTGTVEVIGLPLTVSPASAVPGQAVTIRGSGFTPGAALEYIRVDSQDAYRRGAGGGTDILVSGGGDVLANVDVPKLADSEGDNVLVEIKEVGDLAPDADGLGIGGGNERLGNTRMTIPKPTLTLNPDNSRPGTTVTATGTGFVAGSNVTIMYGVSSTSVNADSTGNWVKAFIVPINTKVPSKTDVTAKGGIPDAEAPKTAMAPHEVPGGNLTVSPASGRPGDTITITADGFQAYAPVVKLTIGNLAIPHAGVNTDGDGDFQMDLTLPALPVGTHSMFVGVGGTAANPGNSDVLVFTVTTGPAPVRPTAEVFKDLIDAGNLERVYHYVNATATWLVFDPRPDFAEFNDYTEATSGQAVWVKVTNAAQFQGEPLFAGWNLIVLR